VLVLKKYLALPTPDKSTVLQVVCHFCEKDGVAKKKKFSSLLIKRTQRCQSAFLEVTQKQSLGRISSLSDDMSF
jgi:hypothetical protein